MNADNVEKGWLFVGGVGRASSQLAPRSPARSGEGRQEVSGRLLVVLLVLVLVLLLLGELELHFELLALRVLEELLLVLVERLGDLLVSVLAQRLHLLDGLGPLVLV